MSDTNQNQVSTGGKAGPVQGGANTVQNSGVSLIIWIDNHE